MPESLLKIFSTYKNHVDRTFHLVATIGSTGQTLIVKEHYTASPIERFLFNDGWAKIWSNAEFSTLRWVQGSDGNDHLTGSENADLIDGADGDDILDGRGGNDELRGGYGRDTYIFSRGYGDDQLFEDLDASTIDRIKFSELNLSDVSFKRNGDALAVSVKGTGDTLTIMHQFGENCDAIELFEFADGTIIDASRVAKLAPIIGSSGDDLLAGSYHGEVLDGGAGDDRLEGGFGNDSYRFGKGYGHDIALEPFEIESFDNIDLIGLAPSDIVLCQNRNDLVIEIKETGETLTLKGQMDSLRRNFEQLKFGDGTIWTAEQAHQIAILHLGDDIIDGTWPDDVLDGGPGDDLLSGGAGNDVLLGGDGNDILTDTYGQNQLLGGNGDDILKGAGLLDGGGGNDSLTFSVSDIRPKGENTLRYGRGYGDDIVFGGFSARIELFNLTPDDIQVIRKDNNIVLCIINRGETLTFSGINWENKSGLEIKNEFYHTTEVNTFPMIFFADGSTWSIEQLYLAFAVKGTEQSDTISGTGKADRIEGLAGDDHISGGDEDDFLDGGSGGDTLIGGKGNDTFLYSKGEGNDIIVGSRGVWNPNGNPNDQDGDNDTLHFTDILPGEITLGKVSNDLIITIMATGEKITIRDQFETSWTGIETIVFSDGSKWDRNQIMEQARSGNGDDRILGTGGNDILICGAGNDELVGGIGSDTYVFKKGDGHDTISEPFGLPDSEDINSICLSDLNPSDISLKRQGTELIMTVIGTGETLTVNHQFGLNYYPISKVTFANGTIWNIQEILGACGDTPLTIPEGYNLIQGTSGNDILTGTTGFLQTGMDALDGGAGNDILSGQSGSDIYIFKKGYGTDLIRETGNSNDIDVLQLVGLKPEDVKIGRAANHLTIAILSTGESIRIENHFQSPAYGLERIVFADSTTWSRDEIQAHVTWLIGTSADEVFVLSEGLPVDAGAGDDLILGSQTNDFIIGGAGDDEVEAGNGQDIAVFSGCLSDYEISSTKYDGNAILIRDLRPNSPDGTDILVDVEIFRFSDGDIDALQFLPQRSTLNGTEEADVIFGTPQDDVINGLANDDQLFGQDGNDEINAGIGNDTVHGGNGDDTIFGGDGNDRLFGDAGQDALYGGAGNDHLSCNGGESSLFGGDGDDTLLGGVGSDFLNGGTGNDRLVGGSGNDSCLGGAGSDTFAFAKGFGTDDIYDFSAAGGDIIEFEQSVFANIDSVYASMTQVGFNTVITADSGDVITLFMTDIKTLCAQNFHFVSPTDMELLNNG